MRKGLAEWQSYLLGKSLPIFKQTTQDVQRLIDQPQLSVTQYVGPILFDPAFTMQVFKFVNSQRVSVKKHPLTTLDSALSLLGQTAFQSLLNEMQLLEKIKLPKKNKRGYKRTASYACNAALQMKSWGIERNVLHVQEIQLATLLQSNVELLLWCYGEDVMPEIEKRCYVDKKSYQQAAQEVLGCDIKELGLVLAEKWNMPEMHIAGLRSKQDDFTLATGASLASELSRIVAHNWYGKDAVDIIQRIAKYQGKAEGVAERILHLNAVSFSDVLMSKGYESSAKLLPMLANDEYIDSQYELNTDKASDPDDLKTKVSQPVQENLKNIKPEKTKVASSDFNRLVKEFKLMVVQKKHTHDLINKAVKLILSCGVDRSVFAVKLPNKKILESKYSAFKSADETMKTFQIPIDNPHLFTLLMEKPQRIFLNKDNQDKYWQTIPEEVKLSIGVEQFFAMSVFVGKHAIGLMYADKITGELTKEEFVMFQKVCQLLSKGIGMAIQNKQNKQNKPKH